MDNREQCLSADVHQTASSCELDEDCDQEDNVSAKLKYTPSEVNKSTAQDIPCCNGINTKLTVDHSKPELNDNASVDSNGEESTEDENLLDEIIETAPEEDPEQAEIKGKDDTLQVIPDIEGASSQLKSDIEEVTKPVKKSTEDVTKQVKLDKKDKADGALKVEDSAEISDDDILACDNDDSDENTDSIDELADSILEVRETRSDSVCSELYLKDSLEQTLEEKEKCKSNKNSQSDNKICDKHKGDSKLEMEELDQGKIESYEMASEETSDEMDINTSSIEIIETSESDEHSLLLELSNNSDPSGKICAEGSEKEDKDHVDSVNILDLKNNKTKNEISEKKDIEENQIMANDNDDIVMDCLDTRPENTSSINSDLEQSSVSISSLCDEKVDISTEDTSANSTLDSTLDSSVASYTSEDVMDCNSLNETAESVVCNPQTAEKNNVKHERKTEKTAPIELEAVKENHTENKVNSANKSSEQLLSKLSVKVMTKTVDSGVKKAKARKSCVTASNNIKTSSSSYTSTSTSISLPASSSITNLTFNVKELEKQGVLDMPKSQKKKVDCLKLKQVDHSGKNGNVWETSKPVNQTSPSHSPSKSPGKSENAFFKRNKLMKRRRRKGKKSGHYRLPGEKTNKRTNSRKKESEERQLNEIGEKANSAMSVTDKVIKTQALELQNQLGELVNQCSDEKQEENNRRAFNESLGLSRKTNSNDITVANVSESQAGGVKQNALDIMTKNSKLSFSPAPSLNVKKAKKSVRNSIDSSSHRTLDSFLKGASYNQMNSSIKVAQEQSGKNLKESPVNEVKRKRKATGSPKVKNNASSPVSSQEEKKRKVEGLVSPTHPTPQLITLVPTGSPPMIPTSINTSPRNIILSPGTAGPQTLIQNGTLNGLPVFQIVNSSQPPQLLTFAQNQVTNSVNPANSQPKGMPVLLAPIQMSSMATAGTQTTKGLPTIAGPIRGSQVVTVANSQGTGMLKSLLTPEYTKHQIVNGRLMDMKQGAKKSSIPNGLYPVTPPKTPEGSENGYQETVEVSPGGSLPPEKEVIPLCTCKISGASFQKVASAVTYCQSLDSVDGKVMGCCNKVTNMQLVRPAVKIPFLAVCEAHRKRIRSHHCCPGCGHYCTQGRFLQCKKEGGNSMHLFHEQCQVIKDGKNYCPHCGDTSAQFELHLTIQEHKPSVVKDNKSNRTQNKARIQMNEKKSAGSDDDSGDESGNTDKARKTPTTSDIMIGPDKYSLEKFLKSLQGERPKKFRHLPKCLYTPAYDNDLERVIYMLEDGHDANEQYDDLEGQGALHAAAIVGSLPIVHVLVQAGASVHMQDKSLTTPVMYAAEYNHPEVVSYLVKAGAIVSSKADDGMTALHYAAKMGHVSIIRQLLDTELVKVDITDDGGWTPLIWAVEHKEMESVKLLLKRNADPNLRDSEENTTLHWAAFAGNVAIAEMLLSAGCDLDSLNMHGDRPLHIAARQDHYECVVLFLARGADVEAKNNKGETPLECCLEPTSAVYLALRVNKQLKKFGAKHMGRPEKLLHRDLSKGRENIPIPCVNQVDDDGIPTDYLYVTDNIETTNLSINRVIGSLQSCQCKDDCSSIYCACGKNSVRCWYDKFGRLVPEFNMLEPPLIFECNRACECWTTCNNRVVQNGVMSRLQVFKTEGRGWGCRTLVDIPRGTFICEYIGEHISDSEADRREDDSYLFDLDNRDGETYCIDARKYGNIARFINHLCEPNLVPVKVFVDSQDLRFPRICLFASRDITAQQELGFDYGEKFWMIKWKQFTCTCGSPKCRYSKDTIQKTLEDYRMRHEDEAEIIAE